MGDANILCLVHDGEIEKTFLAFEIAAANDVNNSA
jgi:hypothetical protein